MIVQIRVYDRGDIHGVIRMDLIQLPQVGQCVWSTRCAGELNLSGDTSLMVTSIELMDMFARKSEDFVATIDCDIVIRSYEL